MEIFNLLSDVTNFGAFGETFPIYLDWIGKIIRFLITGVSSVGVGIILFSLVLKVVVLPFDISQRISMRKQNIKMKENQEKMEKLQKQYANNKDLYNQKVMEMYKENGFSMFSSCLPMILSIVIFMVAIGAFNAYSQFSNVENYNTLVQAYNGKIESYCPEITEDNILVETYTVKEGDEELQKQKLVVKSDSAYVYYEVQKPEALEAIGYVDYLKNLKNTDRLYKVNVEFAAKNEEIKTAALAYVENGKVETEEAGYETYFKEQAQLAVVDAYEDTVAGKIGFLWIKNIWETDASYKHPVLNYDNFKGQVQQEKFSVANKQLSWNSVSEMTNAYTADTYNEVTAKLTTQKSQANGWYVLVVLSIGTILLQQFITQRSQKEQQKYSTVDGQGATQQKTMMIVMTGMFAIFSFMYSSAFSIYMITSNLFSMASTLVINKLVDKSMEKKEQLALQEKHNQRYPGRKRENGNDKDKKK